LLRESGHARRIVISIIQAMLVWPGAAILGMRDSGIFDLGCGQLVASADVVFGVPATVTLGLKMEPISWLKQCAGSGVSFS
jgi:hypothetical protein